MKRLMFNLFLCVFPPVIRPHVEVAKRKRLSRPDWGLRDEIRNLAISVRHCATGRRRLTFWAFIGSFVHLTVLRVADILTGERYLIAFGFWWRDHYRKLGLPFPEAAGVVLVVLFLGSAIVFGYIYTTLFIRFVDHRRIPFGFCRKCRYDLRGAEGANCPECGTPRLRRATIQVTTTPTM